MTWRGELQSSARVAIELSRGDAWGNGREGWTITISPRDGWPRKIDDRRCRAQGRRFGLHGLSCRQRDEARLSRDEATVEAAIASVGYQTNTVARSLKTATTKTVGLAVSAMSNPYFSDIICAIVSECTRLGLMVFLADTQDVPETELSVVRALHQRRVDGIILAPSPDPERRAQTYIEFVGIPCVLVDRAPNERFDQVGLNNRSAMGLLVAHLASFGHRRIGFVAGNPGFTTTLERINGYLLALSAHGLDIDEALLVAGNATTAAATRSTQALGSAAPPDRAHRRQQHGDDRRDARDPSP